MGIESTTEHTKQSARGVTLGSISPKKSIKKCTIKKRIFVLIFSRLFPVNCLILCQIIKHFTVFQIFSFVICTSVFFFTLYFCISVSACGKNGNEAPAGVCGVLGVQRPAAHRRY